MDPRVAGEVRRDGRSADVLDAGELRNRDFVQLEAAEIVGEIQHAARRQPRHRIAQADALKWLEADRGEYDVVFCDPPTFSNSKRADDFDVQRDHVRLVRAAVARLAPGGVLYFSNNFRRFKLDEVAIAEFARVEDISASTIPPDFARNPRIHRAWRITAK